MSSAVSIVWFQQDLRLEDNPALRAAVERDGGCIPVYIWDPDAEGKWPLGAASRWWLHRSLHSLDTTLRQRASRLIIRRGGSATVLQALLRETGATAIYWNRRYEPAARENEQRLLRELRAMGVEAQGFPAALLVEPAQIARAPHKPYQVFTPFWKACLARPTPPSPLPAPSQLAAPMQWPRSLALRALALEPTVDWAAGLRQAWTPGEEGAWGEVDSLLDGALRAYPEKRDLPSVKGTSRLSPHLHFGEIGPRQLWHAIEAYMSIPARAELSKAVLAYRRQLYWREFAHHLLWHFPHTDTQPLRPEFSSFPWREDGAGLKAWQRGLTGHPIVDAGMRELWATGWMHNRVRMLVASFLVKDLLIPWQRGAEWFWDTLVDADLANNSLGWQWTAGCGADAAPFFRVFNPTMQGEKFDPDGAYVRRWVPELAGLSPRWIHTPWQAPGAILQQAGVVLGKTYPRPIVDHAQARERALAAFHRMKRA